MPWAISCRESWSVRRRSVPLRVLCLLPCRKKPWKSSPPPKIMSDHSDVECDIMTTLKSIKTKIVPKPFYKPGLAFPEIDWSFHYCFAGILDLSVPEDIFFLGAV